MNTTLMIISFIVVAIIAFFLGRWLGMSSRTKELASELEKKEEELSELKSGVDEHFSETARLFSNLTDEYKALYQHLSHGANKLSKAPFKMALTASTVDAIEVDDADGEAATNDEPASDEPASNEAQSEIQSNAQNEELNTEQATKSNADDAEVESSAVESSEAENLEVESSKIKNSDTESSEISENDDVSPNTDTNESSDSTEASEPVSEKTADTVANEAEGKTSKEDPLGNDSEDSAYEGDALKQPLDYAVDSESSDTETKK